MSSFGRGSLAQKHAEEGTGLGLPIVKGLIELHGGQFMLRSKLRAARRRHGAAASARLMDALPHIETDTKPLARPSFAGAPGVRLAAG